MLLLIFLLFTQSYAEDRPLPDICKTACVSTFGSTLGKTDDGIEAYSNCKPSCVYMSPVEKDGTFLGIKWQCVEFARRWLYTEHGMIFPSIDFAYEFWSKIDHLVLVKEKKDVPLENHLNGDPTPPQRGDILLYGQDLAGTGHIAIILKVDIKKKKIYIGEENLKNERWPGNYARSATLIKQDEKFWILDPYLIGWKRANPTR